MELRILRMVEDFRYVSEHFAPADARVLWTLALIFPFEVATYQRQTEDKTKRRAKPARLTYQRNNTPITLISLYPAEKHKTQVCRRILSLEAANAICEHAQTASARKAVRDRASSFVPLPDTSSTLVRSGGATATATAATEAEAAIAATATIAPLSAAATKVAANPAAGGATGEDTYLEECLPNPRERLASVGLGRYSPNAENLNDLLSTLFKEADKEEKVWCRVGTPMLHGTRGLSPSQSCSFFHLLVGPYADMRHWQRCVQGRVVPSFVVRMSGVVVKRVGVSGCEG